MQINPQVSSNYIKSNSLIFVYHPFNHLQRIFSSDPSNPYWTQKLFLKKPSLHISNFVV